MFSRKFILIFILINYNLSTITNAGVIKDLFQKLTNNNNKTEGTVKQSAPVCGSGLFKTLDENSLSPEVIFITNRASKIETTRQPNSNDRNDDYENNNYQQRRGDKIKEVAKEFRFHVENITLDELERNGFNRDAPVTILMHGFTSGYPLQAWISAIVESYTIDRETNNNNNYNKQTSSSSSSSSSSQTSNYGYNNNNNNNNRDENYDQERRQSRQRFSDNDSNINKLKHNLLIVNWHYAARGIVYPRAVANIPIVATYITKFINEKLLQEANINPKRIQLIGHSLGAHLAGFIGKNTKSKLGRIYGLDPAGPCFGSISGPLYPASKRLAPNDAEEVITIHTNTALLGIDKAIGKYSIFVEGGSTQPGCKNNGGVLKSLQSLTFDGGDFDTLACSHSRAPNLLTYRHEQIDSEDDCQLVAYECKNWDSFSQGQCGICQDGKNSISNSNSNDKQSSLNSVECKRIGLDWQYPSETNSNNRPSSSFYETTRRPQSYSNNYDDEFDSYNRSSTSTRRPKQNYNYNDNDDNNGSYGYSSTTRRPSSYQNNNFDRYSSSTRRPNNYNYSRNKREERNETLKEEDEDEESSRGLFDKDDSNVKKMFLKTTDTAPYCAFHYQVVLELNEKFPNNKAPPMSLIMQDSESSSSSSSSIRRERAPQSIEQNSISDDRFGYKLTDKIYTHLLTSGKKLKKVDHATILFRNGLPNGNKILNSLKINYMSNINPEIRRKFSTKLCLVKKQQEGEGTSAENRFFFEPCDKNQNNSNNNHQTSLHNNNNYDNNNNNNNHGQEDNNNEPYHNNNYNNNNGNSHQHSIGNRNSSTSRRPNYNQNGISSSNSNYNY